jgi:hypothetical protein
VLKVQYPSVSREHQIALYYETHSSSDTVLIANVSLPSNGGTELWVVLNR